MGLESNIIIFDLEATCWDRGDNSKDWHGQTFEKGTPGWKQANEMETIEIGAVRVYPHKDYEIVDQFQTFIKPVLNPALTDFCKNLTTITQEDVDNAPLFADAFTDFRNWAGDTLYYMAWGRYDYRQLENDCRRSKIRCFPAGYYVNAKEEYLRLTGRKGKGLGFIAKRHNLQFEGVQHRAISDAIMTAKVLQEAKLELNRSIKKSKNILS